MSLRSIRYRLNESNNIWPGFVDILATLLIVIIFILMVFTVSQIYLSDAISGKDKALLSLKNQINELSKVLILEKDEKLNILENLSKTQKLLNQNQSELSNQEALAKNLQKNIATKDTQMFVQDQNIIALSEQIKELLNELRIVAKALEVYEGFETTSLKTDGLGEKINKALATRIDQLNNLNFLLDKSQIELKNKINDLDLLNIDLENNKFQLQEKIEDLKILNTTLRSINTSLGLEDANLVDQLSAIQNKNILLESSKLETEKALELLSQVNEKLILKDEMLKKQIFQYQEVTNDLLAINDSLGLQDASLIDQLEAIRIKNTKLAELNLNLIKKDDTIFNLRDKIVELNNILSLTEEIEIKQKGQILSLNKNINTLKIQKNKEFEESSEIINSMTIQSEETFKQVAFLTTEINILKNEIGILNQALESSELSQITKQLKIEDLGERLNKALKSKVFELQKYRSEFFGKIKSILGERDDIKIVGDRFIFESELLFDSASANLAENGISKLKQIGLTLKETTNNIPENINWIIQVEGHTDNRPISTSKYPSNWELSTSRANSVLKLLLDIGFAPNRLSAAGYGEFYPIAEGDSKDILQQNRRIELKLTSR